MGRSLSTPERTRKEHKDGYQFQTSDQHAEGAQPQLSIGKNREVGVGTYCAQARTDVADAAEHGAEGRGSV